MNKINCLIVDDEEPARILVESYIQRLPHLAVVGKCAHPLEAVHVLQQVPVDLMFLDIQMPELTGVEFLETLSQKPVVIFTTAYKEYALQSYELDVVDYLLKPFRFERFLQAVHKASNLLKPRQTQHPPQETLPSASAQPKDYLLVKSDFKVFRIFYKDIYYIESMKEYVGYHTPLGRTLSLGSLKNLEKELPPDQFMRVHKSFIVNKSMVSTLEGNQLHVGSIKIPIGSSYRERVLKELF